ncbi:cysteine dioxygenase family protein [Streptomyces sp. NBS 14/10]|uniref:cysteine dioxygenase n=1 Tax=Streptomyces sp. NBS 14/10 TaxID=1945643 RepID=UPI000B7F2852|nr:cysteine dioxygenase family protein [Streptomyces sp. NBS 14/10]KAK1181537.1 cysteine dioxygenase family protein [Streptomyces sp. NBS 14/10]NUP41248.1 cupin domain-containing protein [Streptomyces sp.]NUS88934.1 cupin domain-containing protein [Streptomyces sp.]
MNSDIQIAGDPLAIPHLLPPAPAHPSTVAAFAGLARSLAADRARWAPLVQYDATSRWYHRLRTGPGYEVWLLSWVPGQGSGAHDHGASSGVLTVLEGELTERVGHGGRHGGRHSLRAGAQRVFAPGYVHDVVNDALEPAVSLHIYFPGLTDMPMHPSQDAVRELAEGRVPDAPDTLDVLGG